MSCGVDCRCGWNVVLLWLLHRLAAAVLTGPQAWELPYVAPATLKKKKNGIVRGLSVIEAVTGFPETVLCRQGVSTMVSVRKAQWLSFLSLPVI